MTILRTSAKKKTMSLNHALIVLDRLNTTERIDIERDNLSEAAEWCRQRQSTGFRKSPRNLIVIGLLQKRKRAQRVNMGFYLGILNFVPTAVKHLIGGNPQQLRAADE